MPRFRGKNTAPKSRGYKDASFSKVGKVSVRLAPGLGFLACGSRIAVDAWESGVDGGVSAAVIGCARAERKTVCGNKNPATSNNVRGLHDFGSPIDDCQKMVPGAGLEPARLAAGDFESPESTNFTTRAGMSEDWNYGIFGA